MSAISSNIRQNSTRSHHATKGDRATYTYECCMPGIIDQRPPTEESIVSQVTDLGPPHQNPIHRPKRDGCKQEARRESSDRSFTSHKLRMGRIACIRCQSCDQSYSGSKLLNPPIDILYVCIIVMYVKQSFTRWKQPTQARRCPQCSARQAWTYPPR